MAAVFVGALNTHAQQLVGAPRVSTGAGCAYRGHSGCGGLSKEEAAARQACNPRHGDRQALLSRGRRALLVLRGHHRYMARAAAHDAGLRDLGSEYIIFWGLYQSPESIGVFIVARNTVFRSGNAASCFVVAIRKRLPAPTFAGANA